MWDDCPLPANVVDTIVREGLTATDILAADVEALKRRRQLDDRILQQTMAYRDRMRAVGAFYATLGLLVALWGIAFFLQSLGWIGWGTLATFCTLASLIVGSYAWLQYADMEARDPNQYRKLQYVQLPDPRKPRDPADLLSTAGTSTTSAGCTNGACCAAGTRWDVATQRCVA
jgi:hypothetical protein